MPATVKVSRLYFFNITGFPAVSNRLQCTYCRGGCHCSGSCFKLCGSTENVKQPHKMLTARALKDGLSGAEG